MSKTILVLDDEKNIRTLFEDEFKEDGYKVISTDDGEEAIGMLEGNDISLITLDIKMPKMDGLDFLDKVRKNYRDIPIIICTAYENYRYEFSIWAADGYVIKSQDMSEIKGKIHSLIG